MRTLSRREFLKLAAAAMPAAVMARELTGLPSAPARPNIVFVFADQMRACSMGCMNNPEVITPNMDRIAGEGVLVTNAISCQPVCSPYRAQLLTGRYSHANGVIHNDIRLPDRELLLPTVLKQQGYATGYVGKWHLAGRGNPVDAKSRRDWDFWAVRACSHNYTSPTYWLGDRKVPGVEGAWEPDVQTDLAVDYIRNNKTHPFCLFVSFGPPHNPYIAPAKNLRQYAGRKLTARPNVPGGKPGPLKEYYAAITSLDDCLGRIDRALSEAGVADNTILCFTSDHGDMLGSQGQQLKQRPWEESINIPFILRYPERVKAGQRRDWIVSSVDVMPTLLGLCGIPVPAPVQGMDLSPLFRGEPGKEREAAFLFNQNTGNGPGTDWRGIRTGDWVYACHANGDWVMYDLKQDPYEQKNLVNDPSAATQMSHLAARLRAMREQLGENIPLQGKLLTGPVGGDE